MTLGWLQEKRRVDYSQFGEDGIIEAIFDRIGATNKYCLEVGAGDGLQYSNTRRLYEQGWNCILIEQDSGEFEKLRKNAPKAKCFHAKIEPTGKNSLDAILTSLRAPDCLDFISIDIDGDDFHIWFNLLRYTARVICIEHALQTEKSHGQATFEQIEELAKLKGYFVAARTEANSICVLREAWKEEAVNAAATPLKFNIGAGDVDLPGYIAIDRKNGSEAYPLNYPDGAAIEIRASHILEHFSHKDTYDIILHWVKKLRPGGTLKIAVPNAKLLAQKLVAGERQWVKYLFGAHSDADDRHNAYIDQDTLASLMDAAGLVGLQHWKSEIDDGASLPISLNIQGLKPFHWTEERLKFSGIKAVISQPRLGFLDNRLCIERGLLPLGIDFSTGTGVFWGQILERCMEPYMHTAEFILTLDWDSWFTGWHIRRLYQLIRDNPEIDAICPVQCRRSGERPLAGVNAKDGEAEVTVDISGPLTPLNSGHFGLTLIRVSALKKMKHPWFWAQPAPDGTWGHGRLDDDIYFWKQFEEAGNKLFLANQICVGHLQLMCTFPGPIEENWKPMHMYLSELDRDGPPSWCIPKIPILNEEE